MLLAENRKALVPICPDAFSDPGSQALYAAKELRYYLGRVTAASFEIREAAATPCIRLAMTRDPDLGADGFRLRCDESGITVTGGKRGVVYGAIALLERIGCRFFTSTCEKIPVIPTLAVEPFETTEKPAFEYREHHYADARRNPRFAVRCRFNGHFHDIPERMGGHMPYALFVHSFERLVPTSVYGETHPEYFSEIDGKRIVRGGGRTQLCLTNPDVLRIAIESTRRELKAHPGARIISVSQNDWKGNCQCAACRKSDAEEGSPAGTLLRFVNAVAEALEPEFPDVIFDTLAYHYSRPAPSVTRNRKNVCVRLCSIESCFAHPFETCDDASRAVKRPDGTGSSFINDLRDWGRICDRMYVWDYTTCFAHYPAPFPNWRVMQPNVQTMAKNNVKGVFEQACGASRGNVDFNELRMYLISKLLWDPWCDLAKHRREFMDYYYGAAAPALNEYLDLLCDTVEKEDIHIGFNDNLVHAFMTEDRLDAYDALFDRAAAAVAGDALRLARVEKNRLSIRWVRLKRKAMLKGEIDPEEQNAFFADWRAFGLSRIDEWVNLETTHRALLDGLWRGTEYFEHWTGEEPELF